DIAGYGKEQWIIGGLILAIGLPVALFFVSCTGGKTQAKVPYEAVQACQDRVRSSANHPSTVSFSVLGQSSDFGASGGGYRVGLSFEAKNSFGLTTKFNALCKFSPGTLVIDQFDAWETK